MRTAHSCCRRCGLLIDLPVALVNWRQQFMEAGSSYAARSSASPSRCQEMLTQSTAKLHVMSDFYVCHVEGLNVQPQ